MRKQQDLCYTFINTVGCLRVCSAPVGLFVFAVLLTKVFIYPRQPDYLNAHELQASKQKKKTEFRSITELSVHQRLQSG